MKRNHDQMSSESRQTPCAANHREFSNQPTESSSNSLFNFNLSPIRRSLDLRRPVMSQPRPEPRHDVIDLTEEPSSPAEPATIPIPRTNTSSSRRANRPPRFDRNIISLDEQQNQAIDLREESPEIQFLTSRPRSRSLSASRRIATRRRPGHTPAAPTPPRLPHVAVRIAGTAAGERHQHHHHRRPRFEGLELFGPAGLVNSFNDELLSWGDFGGNNFQLPGHLDFLHPGFNYENPTRPQPPPRVTTYDPPLPAQPGYTRSPEEDQILVCPNCDNELGVGEDDVKRQVWVVKVCGHVGPTSLFSHVC